MREATISSELYQELLAGRGSQESKFAVCNGGADVSATERVELLAVLAEDENSQVRERAVTSLLAEPASALVLALGAESPAPALFRYCGSLAAKPEIFLAMARHARCPPYILPAACEQLSAAGLQEIFDDLDLLSSRPYLIGAMMRTPALAPDQREQLRELLEETDKKLGVTVEEDPAEDQASREKRITLLQRLSRMRVVERVQLALKGNREERMALIRDACKVVQRAVLQSPRLSDREVESFSAMASISEDVLRLISRNRVFIGNPIVVRNLVNNPKTPLDISLHFLPNATAKELKALTMNRNIPETLRSMALRLHRQRAVQRT